MKCPRCGDAMQPLLTSMFCPNACDKIEKGPYCPECGSNNTEKFDISGILDCFARCDDVRDSETYHCCTCSKVWNIEPQQPETD